MGKKPQSLYTNSLGCYNAGMKKTLLSPEWVTDKFIIVMLAVFPLWTGFQGYANITFSKFLFFVIVTGLWLALIIAGSSVSGERPIIRAGGWAVLALAAAAFISAAFSPYGTDVIIGAGRYDGLVSLLLYGCIFLGVSAYARPKPLYVWCLAFSVTVCCVVSLLQLLGHDPLNLFPGDMDFFGHGIQYSAEFLGNIGNVDVFATLLCVSVPLFFGAYVTSKDKLSALLLPPAAFALFIAMESDVASAKAGLAVGFILGAVVLLRKRRLKKLLIAAAVAAAAIVLAANVTFTQNGVVLGSAPVQSQAGAEGTSTAYEIGQILHGHFEDSYGSGRIGIWRQLLEVYPERPVLGGGPGTVSDRIDIEYSRHVEETGETLRTRVDNAHNEYLGYLMDDGALGLAAYLALIVLTLARWIQRRRTRLAAFGCGLAGYWAQSFFGLGLCLVLPVVWLVWGLVWSDNHESRIV